MLLQHGGLSGFGFIVSWYSVLRKKAREEDIHPGTSRPPIPSPKERTHSATRTPCEPLGRRRKPISTRRRKLQRYRRAEKSCRIFSVKSQLPSREDAGIVIVSSFTFGDNVPLPTSNLILKSFGLWVFWVFGGPGTSGSD